MTFDKVVMTLDTGVSMNIYSENISDGGNFTLYLRAYYATYQSIFADLPFNLSVIDPCQGALITPTTFQD